MGAARRTITTRIQNKRGKHEDFVAEDTLLLDGELVIVDSGTSGLKLKFGDGVNTYNNLPFYGTIYSDKPEYAITEIVGLESALTLLSNSITQLSQQVSLIPIIPTGMISIWSGMQTNIPSGWVLCDGTNGTPDLTDKFVLGAGTKYPTGSTGGAESVSLTIDQLPAHTHEYTRHMLNSEDDGITTGESAYGVTNKTVDMRIGTTQSTGNGVAHNNMPPYYSLCYIMKV